MGSAISLLLVKHGEEKKYLWKHRNYWGNCSSVHFSAEKSPRSMLERDASMCTSAVTHGLGLQLEQRSEFSAVVTQPSIASLQCTALFCWSPGTGPLQVSPLSLVPFSLRDREKVVLDLPEVWKTSTQVLALRNMWFHLQRWQFIGSWLPPLNNKTKNDEEVLTLKIIYKWV